MRAYSTLFYKVFGNGIVELIFDEMEPVDCEVVIPVNMMMTMSAEQAIEEDVARFKKEALQERQN